MITANVSRNRSAPGPALLSPHHKPGPNPSTTVAIAAVPEAVIDKASVPIVHMGRSRLGEERPALESANS